MIFSKNSTHSVQLRKFPYPYRAALTVCSDIDSTSSVEEFLAIQEFLVSNNQTELGRGLGLEIGNSFFPSDADNPFAYFSQNPLDRQVITAFIKAGYIDVIHSFLYEKRQDIRRIVADLVDNQCRIPVWINHARVPTDLGEKGWAKGDTIGSEYYHTDFSLAALGCRFAWLNDHATITGIVGQDVPLSPALFFAGLNTQALPQSLVNNVFKEILKLALSFITPKYQFRRTNSLVHPLQLGDGQKIFGFIRCNCSHRGFGAGEDGAPGLVHILRPEILAKLINNQGYMIVYTHLGKNEGPPYYLSREVRDCFSELARAYHAGHIYVTTTAKLLTYNVNRKYLRWHAADSATGSEIHIETISDPVRGTFVPTAAELQGITFYTPSAATARLFLNGQLLPVTLNAADHTGRESVSIPLRKLAKIDDIFHKYRAASLGLGGPVGHER